MAEGIHRQVRGVLRDVIARLYLEILLSVHFSQVNGLFKLGQKVGRSYISLSVVSAYTNLLYLNRGKNTYGYAKQQQDLVRRI